MRLKKYLHEEITTATTDELHADSVTSNKILRVELIDDNIKKLVNSLKKNKDITVEIKDNIATIDIPYETNKSIMKKLSKYTV